ncbi:MAG: glycosyltransferase [Candidatus Diapherotrites archaeon]|nr:glycosyltransferase [Candidatus Diapherotrites archaeon]MDZ4256711.1 glycosyltransferase [archaeon]
MRIAIFTDSFWPQINGVTTSILNMVRVLSRQGHSFLIYAPKPAGEVKTFPSIKHVEVVWLPARPLPTYPDYLIAYSFSHEAEKKFKDFNPEIVHIHTPFFVADQGIKLAQRNKIPVIGTFHTLVSEFLEYVPLPLLKDNPIMKQLTWTYTQRFYGRCDLISTPTQVLADELIFHGFSKVRVLSNGIDYHLFASTKATPPKKTKNLVYFGRISFEKRIDVAIEVLKLLREKDPAFILNLIGAGPAETSLKRKAFDLGLGKHVHFIGPKSGKALATAVKRNHVLLAPSPMETQGLYILEAMAAGLPIVGCAMRAIPVALGKNERGLLFANGDARDAAEKVVKIMEHPPLRKKLVTNAKKWVKRYSQEAIAREWLRMYQEMVSQQP